MFNLNNRLILMAIYMGLLISNNVVAKPYTPVSDDEIIIVYSLSKDTKNINKLRRQLDADKQNYTILDDVITMYLKVARIQSDPRYFGYAEALITPYLLNNNLPDEIWLHWADILQHRHDFDDALDVLNKLADKKTSLSQVYLMRAIIHMSHAKYELALNNCKSLILRTSHLVSISCVAQVKSLTGELENSITLLEKVLKLSKDADKEERLWALSLLADMAMRESNEALAEDYYLQALALNNRDYYVLANYADLLIQTKQYARVENLLNEFTYVDSLLLRLIQARTESENGDIDDGIAQLESSYELNEIRGENAHLRDQARFYYKVKHDIDKALNLARRNFFVQKEPADIKLLLNLAIESENQDVINHLRVWLSKQSIEDAELLALIKKSDLI